MLKGLKKTKPSQPKDWQKDYTDCITVQQLTTLHQQILSYYLSGKQQQLTAAQEALKHKQDIYFKQIQSNPGKAHQVGEGLKQGPMPMPNSNYNQSFEDEQPKSRKIRKQQAMQAFKFLPSPKVISNCKYCPQNGLAWIVSSSQYIYLSIPHQKQFQNYFYFNLCPVEHISSSLKLDKNIYEELTNYKKCLIQMFDKMSLHTVFFESCAKSNGHLCVECLVIPMAKAHDLPFFFKQGLTGVEGDWTSNKNIIEIRKEKGGLLKQIPRNFRYFYVDFSLGYGYAHIIEEEEARWNPEIIHQIFASLLGLQKHQVVSNDQYSDLQLQSKTIHFKQIWAPYDWTTML